MLGPSVPDPLGLAATQDVTMGDGSGGGADDPFKRHRCVDQ